ncbi:MAG: thioredoxin fold domain-containing protein [Gammaproteobacteria bacterium]|nr:thioredoxin fold domain-containing protein [Gammaproteobacteria bacterium]
MYRYLLPLFILLYLLPAVSADTAQGKTHGDTSFTIPDWFKHSFLEITDDVREAKDSNKHVMLFMHIERCPYCSRMLNENFREGNNKTFIQNNFDVIDINIRGDREIQWDEKTQYNEKSLARELNVHFTPTIVFLNTAGQKVYQVNGYRNPEDFKHVLNYVSQKQYTTLKLTDYIINQKTSVYHFRSHPLFTQTTDFSKYKGPLAVIYEDKSCAGCDEFHSKVLTHKTVLAELEKFTVVRLDTHSDQPITDTSGNKTSARDWAKKLKLDYRPGIVLFDKGVEVSRADGHLYHFHFKELLRYVAEGFYLQYPSYLQYLAPRQKELLESGVDIDYSL